MTPTFLIAILAGLGGMLGWGFADFFAKKTIDEIGDVTTLFWGQLLGIIPLLLLFFLKPSIPHLSLYGFLFLIVLGVWSGLSYIPTYTAFGKGKVSLLSPIFASYAVIVVLISAIFFHEIIPFGRQLAFAVVFIGVLLINGDPRDIWALITGGSRKEKPLAKGLPEILLAVFLFAAWLIALDRFIDGQYWVPFLLVIRIFSAFSLFLYSKARGIHLRFSNPSMWKYLVCIGLFDVGAFASISYGFSATPYVSIVAMLSGAFSLPTIILARTFLKEKATQIQTLGSFIAIAGIALLALV